MASRRARSRRQRGARTGRRLLTALIALLALAVVGAAIAATAAVAVVSTWLKDLPDPDEPGAFDVARATRIYSADGKLLARLYLENREVVDISEISTDLVNAIVAVEDERFYHHRGVDPIGLARAVVVNLREGFGQEGASTITQQYVRNTILLDERTEVTLARKVREAYLALELEKRYSKREILEMYLNAIYFGEGAYGAQAAARTYFSKRAKDLTLAEAALLAGLPQQPSRLSPYDNPEGALRRRNEVLTDMYKNGYITREQLEAALAEKIRLKRAKEPEEGIYLAPYFVAHVKKELQARFTPAVVFKGGLEVHTTLDTRMQRAAERAVRDALGTSGPEAALVAIDPRTGHVKALVGGRDYRKNKFNLATQGHRQAGSAFKTFTLVTAIQEGMPPTFRIDSSSPAVIPTKPKPWIVSNSEGRGRGMITLASATHASVNTVFARLAWELGAAKIAKTARQMGIRSPLSAYPSITLGTAGVTPLEMASAYGTLATGGVHYEPIVITTVIDHRGKTIYRAKPKGKRVLKPEVASAVTEVLKGVITSGTARRAYIGRPAAGKTGTSQNYRDVWFVGYTPQLVAAVWVGHRTERPIIINGARAFGGTVCAPIWADFMRAALEGSKVLAFERHKPPKYDASKFSIPVAKPPAVVGKSISEARARLSGYHVVIRYVYSSSPAGTVVQQGASTQGIVLYVSKGPRPVAPPPPSAEPTAPDDGGPSEGGEPTATPAP